jgi:hypothetical protein
LALALVIAHRLDGEVVWQHGWPVVSRVRHVEILPARWCASSGRKGTDQGVQP